MAPKQPLTNTDPRIAGVRRRLAPPRQSAPLPAGWDDARAALAIERSTDAFVSIDERGRVRAWNPAAEQLFGWSAAAALGRPLTELVVPERLRAEFERTLNAFVAGGRADVVGKPFESPARRRGGGELTVELSVSALRTADGWCLDTWVRDVTGRRRAEHEADAARRRFFATVVHELATPVTCVLGQLASIRPEDRATLSEPAAQALETLEHETERIARLAADLRVAAQTSSGELAIEKTQVRLGALVAEAVEAARPRAEAKGIELLALIQRDPFYRGDPDRLAQVVHNLIGNAIKFTPAGGRVLVKLISGAGELLIKVTDTGPGIPPERRAEVFERRAGSGPAGGGGMGIGLAVSRAIVEAHGGTLELAGADDGTTIAVHLPNRPPDPGRLDPGYEPRRSLRAPAA